MVSLMIRGVVLLTAVVGIAAAAPGLAHAAAPCAQFDACQYEPNPQYNGPLQNTWSHGLTTMPQLCPGGASLQPCQFYVPEP